MEPGLFPSLSSRSGGPLEYSTYKNAEDVRGLNKNNCNGVTAGPRGVKWVRVYGCTRFKVICNHAGARFCNHMAGMAGGHDEFLSHRMALS